ALEIPLAQLDRLLQDRTGLGQSGETFLVGSDMLMRSDSWKEKEQTALKVKIDTRAVKTWLADEQAGRGEKGASSQAFQMVSNYPNRRGTKVFGAISNVDGLEKYGIHWALLGEMDEAEALGLVDRLRLVVVLLLMGTTVVVSLVAVLITRGIVAPIRKLSDWAGLLARGDLAPVKGSFPANEIGELHGSFSRMVQSFQELTSVCEAVAVGDFRKSVELRGENDALGQAVNQMGENLRAAARQAEVIAQGDFSVQITPWSERDMLGTALLRMTLKLKEMDEANRKALFETRRLADYLDKMPTPVLSVDRNFKIVYINNAGAAFAGLDQAACLGRQCYDLFGNDHCHTRECRIGQAMRDKEVRTAETFIDPGGLNLPVRYTGAPVLDDNGAVVGALEYIVDISEAKQAFIAIEKENWIQSGVALINDRLRGEQELIPLCNNLLSGLARHLPVQAAAMYVTEGEQLELYGSYSATGGDVGRKRFAIGEGVVGQAAYEKKSLMVSDIPEDCVRLVAGTVEAAPRHLAVVPLLMEERVKGVLELGSLTAFSDDDLAFLARVGANIAIAVNTAQSRVQLARLLAETQRQAGELQAQQEELQSTNEELESQTHSLKEREVELQAQHEELMTLNEELEEKTEALERQKADVEQKNRELVGAQRAIEQKAEELAVASKYKSEFMANMSHELRTPLNSLLLLSHNLAQNKEGNLRDDQVESAKVMYSSGNDLLALINEILDLSKIEAGRVELAVADLALKDLAERLRSNFQAVVDDKGLAWSVIIDPQAPEFIATDRQRLEQILKNLIANAIKFTDQGGVTVTLRPLSSEDAPATEGLVPGRALAL
ncbi:MAG: PAS domain-containing protein, partial [Desulfobulbaceae bacterium]|nr:PAS domain-containing protein [Desulfobulbaceae bacterium]